MLYQFPRKYATVNSRKKYYAEYVVRGWVGRVEPHCSSVLIMKGREREGGGERGNYWNTYYVRAHNTYTYTQTLPTNHHARAHVLRT